jgi:transposase
MEAAGGASVEMRELKGLELAARAKILFKDGAWHVPSPSRNGVYRVILEADASACACGDFQLRRDACKHIIAARIVRARDHGGKSPKIDTDAVPKRPTYTQNWSLYNEAQITEKRRFQVLLADLCRRLQDPPPRRGRQPARLADVVFAVCFKVYSGFSSRRFGTDLEDAHRAGHLSRPMHPNKVNCHLENPELAPLLLDLIVRSSLPLRAVETVFAPDSSGFSTSRFVRWYDEKYGVERSGYDWVKVHLICGVKTNVVTAATILERNTGDCPQFKGLVEKTAENFTVKEVPADKAYLSNDNLNLVAGLGGTAFVPFKCNSLSGEPGSVWERMYGYFQYRRDEFLTHYHQRSNVESTFSMLKRKFGDAVRGRTDAAMANEVYCKILCHNLCVVHQSHVELGIEPVFWARKKVAPAADPDILPMVRPG